MVQSEVVHSLIMAFKVMKFASSSSYARSHFYTYLVDSLPFVCLMSSWTHI